MTISTAWKSHRSKQILHILYAEMHHMHIHVVEQYWPGVSTDATSDRCRKGDGRGGPGSDGSKTTIWPVIG